MMASEKKVSVPIGRLPSTVRRRNQESKGPPTELQVPPECAPSKTYEDVVTDSLSELVPKEWVSAPLNAFNETLDPTSQHI